MKNHRIGGLASAVTGLCVCLGAGVAHAHSASNAYLTITAEPGQPVLHAQWDVALRDLEFLMGIDANGDGRLTWGEFKRRRDDVSHYVYSRIAVSTGGKSCVLAPKPLQVDEHADGAYAVLFFDIRCGERAPSSLTLDYSLFFDIDPTHRGIFVLRKGDEVSSALFAPDKRHIEVKL